MSSRRSARVASLSSSRAALSYREVDSDDDSSARHDGGGSGGSGDNSAGRRRGAATKKARQQAAQAEGGDEDEDDDVIVLDDGEANELQAVQRKTPQQTQAGAQRDDEPEEEEEKEEEQEEQKEEASSAKRPKRQRAAAAKQRKPVRQKADKQPVAASEEAVEPDEEAGDDEERLAQPAKARKRKRATMASKKPGRKAAAGDVSDPIAVDDGDDEDEGKPKKSTKPKKEKQPALIPHIRTVSTAVAHSNKLIGAHVGTAGGVHFGPHNAALMGARCFAMDTRSKRRWVSPPYSASVIQSFHAHMRHYGYSGSAVLPHGSYLTNLGCLSDELWARSKACISEELERCQQLGVTRYVFHPGRAATSGEEREAEIRQEKDRKRLAREKAKDRKKRAKAGEEVSDDENEGAETASSQPALDPSEYLFRSSTPAVVRSYIAAQPAVRVRSLGRLVAALNELLSPSRSVKYPDVHILIETMAGTGNQLCSRFEELRYCIDALDDQSRIGVCLDTCHVFAADARYDMRQREGYERVMKEVEDIVGWRYVLGMHMNDSKCALGSRRDRHENIGDGEIGLGLFDCIVNDQRWDGVPIVLETPCRTPAKDAAKRRKKALAAGEPVEGDEADDNEDDGDDDGGDDDEGEDGGKKGKKGKPPKEREDWVKSYSDEIDMLYGLERRADAHSKPRNRLQLEEAGRVKEETREQGGVERKAGQEESVVAGGHGEEAAMKDVTTKAPVVTVKVEKQKHKVLPKRGRKVTAKAAAAADKDADGDN